MRWGCTLLALCGCNVVFGLDEVPASRIRTLAIDPRASESLVDFPVSIVLTDAELGQLARPDGSDIWFSDAAGAQLPYEIVAYQAGALEAWVRVTLPGPTQIEMHYGATPPPAPPSPWSARYAAVWHLGDTGPALDSTPNHFDLHVTDAVPPTAPGIIGNGRAYDASQGTQRICSAPSIVDGTHSFAFAAWLNINGNVGADNFDLPLDAGGGDATTPGFSFEISPQALRADIGDGTRSMFQDFSARPTNRWISLVAVVDRDASMLRTFIDGVEDRDAVIFSGAGAITNSSGGLCLSGVHQYTGGLDEVRIYATPPSSEWIRAEYNNVFERDTFVHLEAE